MRWLLMSLSLVSLFQIACSTKPLSPDDAGKPRGDLGIGGSGGGTGMRADGGEGGNTALGLSSANPGTTGGDPGPGGSGRTIPSSIGGMSFVAGQQATTTTLTGGATVIGTTPATGGASRIASGGSNVGGATILGGTSTGGVTGTGGSLSAGGTTALAGATAKGGSGGTSNSSSSSPPPYGEVTFSSGMAMGLMTGYGWADLGQYDTMTSPTCESGPITSTNPCNTTTRWSAPDALCMSGRIPALPASPTQADYDNNWGMLVAVNACEPSDAHVDRESRRGKLRRQKDGPRERPSHSSFDGGRHMDGIKRGHHQAVLARFELSVALAVAGMASVGACSSGGGNAATNDGGAGGSLTDNGGSSGNLGGMGGTFAVDDRSSSRVFPSISVGSNGLARCGVNVDKTITCWDCGESFAPPTGQFNEVSLGHYSACGLRVDGTLVCWGLKNTTPPQGTFVTVSVSNLASGACAVRIDGAIVCWGDSSFASSPPPAGRFTSVSVAKYGCGVKTDGTVACWGKGSPSALPAGPFTSFSVGGPGMCGVKSDGSIACMSNYAKPEDCPEFAPPEGTFASVSVGAYTACGVRTDGTVPCWSCWGPSSPFGGGTFTSVSAGGDDSACAVSTDGTVACWGNGHGGSGGPGGGF